MPLKSHLPDGLSTALRLLSVAPGCAILALTIAVPWLAGLALVSHPVSASEMAEPAIKTAGLFKILSFVEWPAELFATDDSPLVVGIFGGGPIAELIPGFAENEAWNGRRLAVRRVNSAAAAAECHVVFVGRSEQENWTLLRSALHRRPVLTVGDTGDFARNGGMVQLAIARNRLHLLVNVAAARAAGITISSKVLRLAEVVGDTRP